MFSLRYSGIVAVIPAVLIIFMVYPIGINTFVTTTNFDAWELNSMGPGMILRDISKGFIRDHPFRPYPLAPSIIMSSVYVPYVWARTAALPPYDLNKIDELFPSLKYELIVIMRSMNVAAALAILFITFYLTRRFCKTLLAPFLASLMVALNVDLMFQSGTAYYENWSFLWVMLSALFFIRSYTGTRKKIFWFCAFTVASALAISYNERMAGYYIFTAPLLLYSLYMTHGVNGRSVMKTVLVGCASLGLWVVTFCLTNNVFHDGLWPVMEYIRYKAAGINSTSERLNPLGLLMNQLRCQGHALWLIFWNTGGIVPFFSLCGVYSAWRKACRPALLILLFPLGYQVFGVGLPGWTSGRYIMGQTIFAILFAGLGTEWCMEYAKTAGKMVWFRAAIISALVSQLFFMTAVKVADIYYNPYRMIESIIRDPANRDKKIVIRGMNYPMDAFSESGVRYDVVREKDKPVPRADIVISNGAGVCGPGDTCKKEFRRQPDWLVFLVERQCYLYVQWWESIDKHSTTRMTIEWRNRE